MAIILEIKKKLESLCPTAQIKKWFNFFFFQKKKGVTKHKQQNCSWKHIRVSQYQYYHLHFPQYFFFTTDNLGHSLAANYLYFPQRRFIFTCHRRTQMNSINLKYRVTGSFIGSLQRCEGSTRLYRVHTVCVMGHSMNDNTVCLLTINSHILSYTSDF